MVELNNIDLYKNGYTIQEFDCIQIPMAGACGAFDYDNYYYYACITCISDNWNSKENMSKSFLEYNKQLLDVLNLKFEAHKKMNKQECFDFISQSLMGKKVILLKVKYKWIFYNKHYKDDIGDTYHMLVVDSYDADKKCVTVRDTAFFRHIKVLQTDADILFPIQLTDEILWDMFSKTQEDSDQNEELAFSLYKEKNSRNINKLDVLEFAMKSIKEQENLLGVFLKEFEQNAKVLKNSFEEYNRRFVGSIAGLFKTIQMWLSDEKLEQEEMLSLKQKIVDSRKKIVFNSYKKSMEGGSFSEETLNKNLAVLEECDELLIQYLQKLAQYYMQNECYISKRIDLNRYFNNRAFEESPSNEAKADLSGNGVIFVMPEYKHAILEKNFIHYNPDFKLDENNFDNISCQGQKISLDIGRYKKICLLACSEYGSYAEVLRTSFEGSIVEEVPLCVSDFYLQPIYNEKTFCKGATYKMIDSEITKMFFPSQIFSYEIVLSKQRIDSIILPNRRNIHIFSIVMLE